MKHLFATGFLALTTAAFARPQLECSLGAFFVDQTDATGMLDTSETVLVDVHQTTDVPGQKKGSAEIRFQNYDFVHGAKVNNLTGLTLSVLLTTSRSQANPEVELLMTPIQFNEATASVGKSLGIVSLSMEVPANKATKLPELVYRNPLFATKNLDFKKVAAENKLANGSLIQVSASCNLSR